MNAHTPPTPPECVTLGGKGFVTFVKGKYLSELVTRPHK